MDIGSKSTQSVTHRQEKPNNEQKHFLSFSSVGDIYSIYIQLKTCISKKFVMSVESREDMADGEPACDKIIAGVHILASEKTNVTHGLITCPSDVPNWKKIAYIHV
jgi:hypothetical protein